MKRPNTLAVVTSALLFSVAGCTASLEKSENPLSPSIAGPIPGVVITPPLPVGPKDGANIAVDTQPITLELENSNSTSVRPFTYTLEIATDTGFSNKVFVREGVAPGDGRTSFRLPDRLGTGRTYYWRAQAVDGANSSEPSGAAHFNIFTPIVIEKPSPRQPVNNVRLDTLQPEFKIANAPRSGPVGQLSYVIELADSDSFANKLAVWVFFEQSGETSFTAPANLGSDRQYFWHARAYDGQASGPWSETQVFRTKVAVVAPPLPPPGGGASCSSTVPLAVLQCRRNQHSAHMSQSETAVFLREVARDLNKNGYSGGPMGLYKKTGGFNCDGFSCDILCSTRAAWDVLLDADGSQIPTWGELAPPGPNTCDIR
jgi:hypothetical protein